VVTVVAVVAVVVKVGSRSHVPHKNGHGPDTSSMTQRASLAEANAAQLGKSAMPLGHL